MSVTAILWLLLFATFVVLGLARPRWGAVPYLQSAFAFPAFFWWGKGGVLAGQRWSLYAGLILLLSVLMHAKPRPACGRTTSTRLFGLLLLALAINATIVTFLWSINFTISSASLFLNLKIALFAFLLEKTITTEVDVDFVLIAMTLGLGFLGFEATVFKGGDMIHGRLEHLGIPGANSSNQLSCLTVTLLPIVGGFAMVGTGWRKWAAMCCAPFILNISLLCSSRGGFLAVGASAASLLLVTRGKERRYVIIGMLLGGVGLLFLLKDVAIIDRFATTFASGENRDASASSRLGFWNAGIKCLEDHPLGVGGGCYKLQLSIKYIADISTRCRAVHNGPLDEALAWGCQGLLLRLIILSVAVFNLRAGSSLWHRLGDPKRAFQGNTMLAGIVGFFVSAFFGDFLDSEWGVWMCAIASAYLRTALVAQSRVAESADFDYGEFTQPFVFPVAPVYIPAEMARRSLPAPRMD